MKDIMKIFLLEVPPGLEAALREQLPENCAVIREAGTECDLVVSMRAYAGARCPVLVLAGGRLRLGGILRRMGMMLQEPALYLGETQIGPWTLRPQDRLLAAADGREVALTDREVDMLVFLAMRPGRAVGRDELLKGVWRYQEGLDTHTLETHIYRLRQKTGEPDILATEPGGYRLCGGKE